MTDGRPQDRDPQSGRYTFDGRLDRLCVCGHRLGDHAAVAPHECFIATMAPYTPCDCAKFRRARMRAHGETVQREE